MVEQIQDLQFAFSDTYIEFLAIIFSIRACTVANRQGQTTIVSNGLMITSYPFGDGEGNMGYYVVFKHTELGMVILKGMSARGLEEAIVSFFRELERMASEIMIEMVAREAQEKKASEEKEAKERDTDMKDAGSDAGGWKGV
jgi:hypothetical protein